MSNITLIAAIGKNKELGYQNELIWKLKKDLLFFKEQTIGKYIVMGRKTFLSLPKLLPERKHIVLTTNDLNIPNVLVFHSLDSLLEFIQGLDEEIMIIGGESLYKIFFPYASKMILTEIDSEFLQADTYFPDFSQSNWNKIELDKGIDEDINYKHLVYKRRETKWKD